MISALLKHLWQHRQAEDSVSRYLRFLPVLSGKRPAHCHAPSCSFTFPFCDLLEGSPSSRSHLDLIEPRTGFLITYLTVVIHYSVFLSSHSRSVWYIMGSMLQECVCILPHLHTILSRWSEDNSLKPKTSFTPAHTLSAVTTLWCPPFLIMSNQFDLAHLSEALE